MPRDVYIPITSTKLYAILEVFYSIHRALCSNFSITDVPKKKKRARSRDRVSVYSIITILASRMSTECHNIGIPLDDTYLRADPGAVMHVTIYPRNHVVIFCEVLSSSCAPCFLHKLLYWQPYLDIDNDCRCFMTPTAWLHDGYLFMGAVSSSSSFIEFDLI